MKTSEAIGVLIAVALIFGTVGAVINETLSIAAGLATQPWGWAWYGALAFSVWVLMLAATISAINYALARHRLQIEITVTEKAPFKNSYETSSRVVSIKHKS